MSRRLPPQYEGWEALEREFRARPTPELVHEIQDGPPQRRLAALSVINLDDVAPETIEDWLRTLPDVEANELAGAIPALRPAMSCHDGLRWVQVACRAYERRRLPTFLAILMATMDSLENQECAEAPVVWERLADWLGALYDRLAADEHTDALEDLLLFVFDDRLSRDAVFEAFCALLARHRQLALRVSHDPRAHLGGLPEARQFAALEEAERGGGLALRESLARLRH